MSVRFWRWWWYGGKELVRELWYRAQMLLVVTFVAWVVYSYGVKAGWWS